MIETRTVRYDNYQLPVLDGHQDVPGWGIPLSLKDENGIQIGNAVADENGQFEITLNRLPLASDWISIVPNWYVNGELKFGLLIASQDLPYTSWVWSLNLSDYGRNGNYSELGTIRITEREASGGLYLYQQLLRAYQDVQNNYFVTNLSQLPSMAVVWKPGVPWSCGTCYVHNWPNDIGKVSMQSTMYVGGGTGDESVWGYPTILHEFGHYVMASLYGDDTDGGDHNMSTACDPQVAWSEGWATFYALMALSLRSDHAVSQYWRVLSSGSFWLDYAHLYDSSGFGSLIVPRPDPNNSQKMKQFLPEGWVTFILYHLWDGLDMPDPETPADPIRMGTAGIINSLSSPRYKKADSYLDSNRETRGRDFVDFVDATVCRISEDDAIDIIDYIYGYDFPYDIEPKCPK